MRLNERLRREEPHLGDVCWEQLTREIRCRDWCPSREVRTRSVASGAPAITFSVPNRQRGVGPCARIKSDRSELQLAGGGRDKIMM